jgi:hypothetical protein
MGRFNRNRIGLFAIATAVLLASVAVVLFCVPVARIDQATCDLIRPGMTVGEAEAIIGGISGWYDGVTGIDDDSPGEKGYKPHWIGSKGSIILKLEDELDHQGRVAEAKFYPGKVLSRSVSMLVWERLTRNAFGTGRTDLVIEVGNGFFLGLVVTCPLVVVALLLFHQGAVGWAYGFCVLGAVLSLALLILAVGVISTTVVEDGFSLLGASSSGLIGFSVGCIFTGRRKPAGRGAAPDRGGK